METYHIAYFLADQFGFIEYHSGEHGPIEANFMPNFSSMVLLCSFNCLFSRLTLEVERNSKTRINLIDTASKIGLLRKKIRTNDKFFCLVFLISLKIMLELTC